MATTRRGSQDQLEEIRKMSTVRRGSQDVKQETHEKQFRSSITNNQDMPRRLRAETNQKVDWDENEMPKRLRKSSEGKTETLAEAQKRRRSSVKPARLSLQTLSEHQSELSRDTQRRRRRTTTENSITDNSTESESRERAFSLYGVTMSLRALRVTRRLSVASFTKSSIDIKPPVTDVKYENTYKMEAGEGEKFRPGHAQKVMEHMLKMNLKDREYSGKDASRWCCTLSNGIKTCLRQQNMPRYKLVCHVTIGQKQGQDIVAASRCLWDKGNDNYACATFENKSLFAFAVAYAVYFE